MSYYLTVAGLVAMFFFWGAGLAWLVVPGRWRMCRPLVALPAGLMLQSAVVWAAGWLPLAGTEVYGRETLLLPLALLGLALWRTGPAGWGWGRSAAVVLALSLCVALLAVSPWARRGGAVTTISNGSCDAADYAAGARVLREFRPDDRGGFIGQREVAGVLEVDNFFDHWRRLNHFTPAGLLALNSTLLGRPVHRLTGLLGAGLLAVLVPVTVLVARSVVRLPHRAALAVAAAVGIGPVQNYAVYQVALGQLIAAAGVGVLVWGVAGMLREATSLRRAGAWLGVLAGGWWLLVGGYTFFLVVALAPVSGMAAWWLLRRGGAARTARAGAVLGAAALLAGVFGWERLAGFALRWMLHDMVEYGWPIPWLRPEGWLGLVRTAELHPMEGLRGWPVGVLLTGLAFWPCWRRVGWGSRSLWTVAGLVGPAVAGYVILSVKGAVPGSNASYDAYKLFACFQPVLLAGLFWWWRWLRGWVAVVVPLAAVLIAAEGGGPLRQRAAARPLEVHADLAALRQVEQSADIGSVNILCNEMWPRLWANAFLLRKAQYFAEPTYEGRRPTRLEGEWNLVDSIVRVEPAKPADYRAINHRYALVRASAPVWLRANLAGNWHPRERSGLVRWRWAGGPGRISLHHPGPTPVRAELLLNVRGLRPGRLWVRLDGETVAKLSLERREREMEPVTLLLPPGASMLTLETEAPADSPGGDDPRRLSFALYELTLRQVRPASGG